jgi:hypothetical protein
VTDQPEDCACCQRDSTGNRLKVDFHCDAKLAKRDFYAMETDQEAIYIADSGSPAVVLKIDKQLMAVTARLPLKAGQIKKCEITDCLDRTKGENDVRSLMLDPEDEWMYACTRTQPGRVVKINRRTMTRTKSFEVSILISNLVLF